MLTNPTRKGFITNLQLSEAKRIANTKEPSTFDKKKLIQIGWKLFKGQHLPVDRIDEDHETFENIYNMVRKNFRDENTNNKRIT